MQINPILELNQRAKQLGRQHRHGRALFAVLQASKGRHFRGVVGPRGAGKTILLQQLANGLADACYISADVLDREVDLFELVRHLSEHYRFKTFLIDEIHYLSNPTGALKQMYDFLDIEVVFTSSVAIGMHETAHDLARRVRLHHLDYFSYREYLDFAHGRPLPALTLEALLAGDILPEHLRASDQFGDYLRGGLLPFALEEPDPLPLLKNTIETIILRDIPRFLRLHVDELDVLRRVVAFIGRSEVDGINYSSLSANLGITKYKAEQYIGALERAFVVQRLFPAGTNVLREPKVLLVPPIRALHRPLQEVAGGLREDFFCLAMRQAGIPMHYLKGTRGQKTPDFLIDLKGQKLVLEIGGKGKGRSQFKGIEADQKLVLAENAVLGNGRLPLHLAGFLA